MNDEAIVIIWGQIAGGRYKEREKKNEPEEAIPTTCTSWGKKSLYTQKQIVASWF